MRQSDTLAELAKAMSAFQGQVHGAKKNAKNPHLKNEYADLSSIWAAIRAPLSINGLSVIQLPAPGEPGTLRLMTRLFHSSGEYIESEFVMPVAKNDPQGFGSALSYARRYALAAMLGITQEDDDGEGAMPTDTGSNAPAKVQRINGGKSPEGLPGGAPKAHIEAIGKLIAFLGWDTRGAVGWLEKHYKVKTRAELKPEQAKLALVDLVNRIDCGDKAPDKDTQTLIEYVTGWEDYAELLNVVEAREVA